MITNEMSDNFLQLCLFCFTSDFQVQTSPVDVRLLPTLTPRPPGSLHRTAPPHPLVNGPALLRMAPSPLVNDRGPHHQG